MKTLFFYQNTLISARSFALIILTGVSTIIHSQSLVTVTDCNLNGWERHGQPASQGEINFVNGPSIPPLGEGSVQFINPDNLFKRLKNNLFVGTRISDITEFSYSTYVEQSADIDDNIGVALQIDVNEDGLFDFPIVFIPNYQTGSFVTGITPDQGTTQLNVWQTWDLLNGSWWKGPAPTPENGGVLFNLPTLISQYPLATIMNQGSGPGSMRINTGFVYAGPFIAYFDNFKIGVDGFTTTFDFEGTIADAGPDQYVFYGYGSNCTLLQGEGAGGIAPYSYSWSGGDFTSNDQNPIVCFEANTNITLTVTDGNGCTGADAVTVFVTDIRCGPQFNKVKVCHNGQELCIASESVQVHLNHGDELGTCEPNQRIKPNDHSPEPELSYNFNSFHTSGMHFDQMDVFPIPSHDIIQYQIGNSEIGPHTVSLINVTGETVFFDKTENQELNISFLPAGVYYLYIASEVMVGINKIIKL